MPVNWHNAIIQPLLKPNKEALAPESYRPISLTSTFCKVVIFFKDRHFILLPNHHNTKLS